MSAQDGRYAAVLTSLVERLEPLAPGIGIIIVPSAEHAVIAAALAPKLGAQVGALDQAITPAPGPLRMVVAGLPADGTAAKRLSELNGRRDFILARGGFLVLLLSAFELAHVQQHARDLYSARLFLETVPFQPDAGVDAEAARASLARYYDARFGRLDLRGFIRSEAEDVSFPVEDVVQELSAFPISRTPAGDHQAPDRRRSIQQWLSSPRGERRFVILAHPGSGKTFLLRWLALALVRRRPDLDLGVKEPLPLLVSLAAYARAPQAMGLSQYVTEMLLEAGEPAAHRVARAIADGEAVFLLDGMDEAGDEVVRGRVTAAIRDLYADAPRCMVIVTSRIAGYGPDTLSAHHLMLSAFDSDRIRRFLVRWCELYAVTRLGSSDAVRSEGLREGKLLADDVLGNPGVRALAGNPLLLTVLAIVHRAGVRLPDHRVELYAHATRVLVERWNRIRSLSGAGPAPPLKAVDAVRLLGPLALRMIAQGASAVVSEDVLRAHIERALAAGALRAVSGADEVIALFRNALGLLVEQAPGLYSFLHLTLAEYFAAWELVRSDDLDRLAADPTRAYTGHYREVLLLAAGELGVLRADDQRLDHLVETLVDSASRRAGRPSPAVPSLLGGLLADDPHLTTGAAQRIVRELVPKWWFQRIYGGRESLGLVIDEALEVVRDRIMRGRFRPLLHDGVQAAYGATMSASFFRNLERGGASSLAGFLELLTVCGVDYGPQVELYLTGREGLEALVYVSPTLKISRVAPDVVRGRFPVSRDLDRRVRAGELRLKLAVTLYAGSYTDVEGLDLPWSAARPTGNGDPSYVELELDLPCRVGGGAEVAAGSVAFVPDPAASPSATTPSA